MAGLNPYAAFGQVLLKQRQDAGEPSSKLGHPGHPDPALRIRAVLHEGGRTPEVEIQQIYRGIIPFVILQLCALALLMAFAEIVLWLPRVLLN